MRQRGFESRPVLLVFDNPAHTDRAHDVAAACRLAEAEARVQFPLGALDEQDVGKPGIPPGTDVQRWSREHEIAGSNPAVLTDSIAVGPVLVRVGGC